MGVAWVGGWGEVGGGKGRGWIAAEHALRMSLHRACTKLPQAQCALSPGRGRQTCRWPAASQAPTRGAGSYCGRGEGGSGGSRGLAVGSGSGQMQRELRDCPALRIQAGRHPPHLRARWLKTTVTCCSSVGSSPGCCRNSPTSSASCSSSSSSSSSSRCRGAGRRRAQQSGGNQRGGGGGAWHRGQLSRAQQRLHGGPPTHP